MYIFHLLRSFVPSANPLGFGGGDFLELAAAVLLVGMIVVSRSRLLEALRGLAIRPGWCMLTLALLPIALRLALIPPFPIPEPAVSDDFSYILAADTLRHLRLANPPHPFSQFFETFFVLQQPAYSSIFPLGQALAIAAGWSIFGHPWAGIALSAGALCALCYWMLLGWTSPGWALAGGLLGVIDFGPLSQWMNSYWGGAVSGCAGCLVFGALPRIRTGRRARDPVLLGIGLGLQLLTRPFEFIFLAAAALLFFLPSLRDAAERRTLAKVLAPAALAFLPALALTLLHDRAVSGSWTTLPYEVSRHQYGVPTTFTPQANPTPSRQLTREQELDYEVQSAVHGSAPETWSTFWSRWAGRLRFYRFFLPVPLYLALPFFVPLLRVYRNAFALAVILLFSVGTNFYPYFYPHYIAAVACLILLVAVESVRSLSRIRIRGLYAGADAARLLVALCSVNFLFWYGLHFARDELLLAALTPYETWDAINHDDPQGRIAVAKQLAAEAGRQLVFVRYASRHTFEEWVHNEADIDNSRIVWARDLGADKNETLLRYYPGRKAWLLEPDNRPPKLAPYPAQFGN
jgi:hypothetical protein